MPSCSKEPASNVKTHGMGPLLRSIGGFTLIGLGLPLIFVPILPGVPLVIAGAALLGWNHPLVRAAAQRLRRWRRGRAGS